MLINVTNHRINLWDTMQTKKAEIEYGSLHDIGFPNISIDMNLEDINLIANEYFGIISALIKTSNDKFNAVHIAGEYCFTYRLLKLLENENIKAVTSVTERNSVEENGVKISKFSFAGFRNYF